LVGSSKLCLLWEGKCKYRSRKFQIQKVGFGKKQCSKISFLFVVHINAKEKGRYGISLLDIAHQQHKTHFETLFIGENHKRKQKKIAPNLSRVNVDKVDTARRHLLPGFDFSADECKNFLKIFFPLNRGAIWFVTERFQ